MKDLRARLQSHILIVDGCWEWQGFLHSGYGHIKVHGKVILAHRVSYELHRGLIPTGMEIDHLCRNRRCVNPDHLEVVTRRENWQRGISITRFNADKTHCIHGHPFDDTNTYLFRAYTCGGTPYVGRGCRACRREATKRRNAKRKAA